MERLKPCPFCGSEAKIVESGMGVESCGYAQCTKCCSCSPFFLGEGCYQKAIQAWNTRYEPPTPGGAIVPAGNERMHDG